MNRRAVLARGLQSGVALGAAKAIHNTLIGYGQFGVGENLTTQDLSGLLAAGVLDRPPRTVSVGSIDARVWDGTVRYDPGTGMRPVDEDAPEGVAELERDVRAIAEDRVTFVVGPLEDLFAREGDEHLRPHTVAWLRGSRSGAPATVRALAGTSPRHSPALIESLVTTFRNRTRYDVPRYLAGSIDDNVLPVEGDLRDPLRPEVDLERLTRAEEPIALFCTEYTRLANAAVQAAPAATQSLPLAGLTVRNARHGHVYNGFATVRRADNRVVVHCGFADYTETTLVDDFRVRRLLDGPLDAYNGRHRADTISWH